MLHGYHLSWGSNVNDFGLYINGHKHGAHWYAFSDKDLSGSEGVTSNSFLFKVNGDMVAGKDG